ncbi:hypothetical protein SETIT_4G202700v2 [Setaria italica]|uniref:Uncharacterized protein n=1 Tax=Setaria italica TaxID=4555 RepID=A0A368QY32_SETIT|nr:hypothetical protein SETIT_4G202700v2 [Setaria italica]
MRGPISSTSPTHIRPTPRYARSRPPHQIAAPADRSTPTGCRKETGGNQHFY